MLMAISGKGEANVKGHRQGNKAADTSAQSRMKSRDRGIDGLVPEPAGLAATASHHGR
jgi:hypothetical protein